MRLSSTFFLSFCPFIPPSTMLFHWPVWLFLQFPFCLLSLTVNPFLCLRLPFKSSLPEPKASQSLLYTVPFLFFKYNYFFTHGSRITFQRRRENPICTWFLLSLSRQCQPLECWSQKYLIPATFIKFVGQIEPVWYVDLIKRVLKVPIDAVH